ncbi:M20 family metallopeptidase [Enterovibrio makurazakiensis]|uniref:M20 family metallopeptidase n=1 Tax=Enterovibrio gelatinilyticus TaxID=2899819 RepID=A0ABT5R3Q2_9GAMM|nr:M20 family metallopeptidase [Enterovibrio sp. ZSDZ42]MDD1794897.1 M20 family metallopeptidase [Enterovibrio sp. ZSDZ42]
MSAKYSQFNLDSKLLELHAFSVNTRRDLHQIPEASGQEFKTTAYCQALMTELGYALTTYEGFTGFIADLTIDENLDRVAFRADMDALEMDDMTENDYRSQHDGCSHNCGHDTHMAIILTTAKFLSENKQALKHNVRFVFQMAEEDMRVPGASKMVELGCMNGVSEVYALHNDAALEYGMVKINNGIMSSYGSAWTLDVNGVSAHGSTPQKGLDAIREASRIIMDMDYIVAKRTNPFSPAVFGCGMFNGGSIPNAIPDHAQARGTIRAMDAETDKILKDSFDSIVKESEIRGFKTTMECEGYPAVINHPDAYQRVVDAARETVPADRLDPNGNPMTGSEDFSLMVNAAENQKGAMFFLGSGNKDAGICNYLHSNPYYVDDDFLLIGAQIFIHIACH